MESPLKTMGEMTTTPKMRGARSSCPLPEGISVMIRDQMPPQAQTLTTLPSETQVAFTSAWLRKPHRVR
jgi:hypothetical protein